MACVTGASKDSSSVGLGVSARLGPSLCSRYMFEVLTRPLVWRGVAVTAPAFRSSAMARFTVASLVCNFAARVACEGQHRPSRSAWAASAP